MASLVDTRNLNGLGNLNIGTNVDIKRTDGRVHSAVISGINMDSKTVTVEWFEKGETKGKEVDINIILSLNRHLMASEFAVPQPMKVQKTSQNQNVRPNGVQQSLNGRNNKANKARYTNVTPAYNNGAMNNNMHNGSSNGYNPAPAAPETRHTTALPEPKINPPPPAAQIAPSNSQSTIVKNSSLPISRKSRIPRVYSTMVPKPVAKYDQSKLNVGVSPPEGRKTTTNVVKESNVVKEVENMKKKREERRAKQEEQKMMRQELMNLDPGNPNWEFLAMIREYRANLEYRPLRDGDLLEDHQITVCVRKRPMNKKEKGRKEVDVITVPLKDTITIHEPKQKVDLTKYLDNQNFRFDCAFDEDSSNELVYNYTARPLVETVFDGGMATCFAYGQTGSGKTHTMGGDFIGKNQDCTKGIYALAAMDVFRILRSSKYSVLNLAVSCSFFEIYSGKVFDLLAQKSKLRVLEDGKQQVQVVGLTEKPVECVDDVLKLINLGNVARTSGQTAVNQHSSRSHAVFQIVLRIGMTGRLHGKFSLIDLAGNERGADTTSANRTTRMEGAEINKSLLALKECIRALGRKGAHLPFRASKLTQVLRDSFIGEKSKTCMIAMISPGLSSCENSLNTLRYADRVKELGASDPAAGSNRGGTIDIEDDDDINDDDDDLAQLRSLNEQELSDDLFHHQSAITHLQTLEDEVLDAHRSALEENDRWTSVDKSLLKMTDEVDYDVDAYSQQLEDLLAERMEFYSSMKNKVTQFRRQLAEEEKISRNFKK